MKMKNRFLTVLLTGLCFAGCEKQLTVVEQTEQQKTWFYVNTFAFNGLNTYYLWKEEVAAELKNWKTTDDPFAKVQAVRYKDDHWTFLSDDFNSLYGATTGHRKTYGFGFGIAAMPDDETVCVVVTYTYAGSPAEKAGLKRGDIITELNGSPITRQDYSTVINQAIRQSDQVTLGLSSGTSIQLTSREMYENPVLLSKIFDCGGKKVGYLVYTNFTLDSYKDLIDACTAFKNAGVSELILDLRYNNGGYVIAEQFVASMLAPEAEVQAGSIQSTDVYNSEVMADCKKLGLDVNTYFTSEYSFSTADGKKYNFSTAKANLGISKLYAIVSSGTASASEAVLCDLYPYMDITLVGSQTSGKYCTGLIMQGPDFFEDSAKTLKEKGIDAKEGKQYTDNWAIYLMCSRFADKNGETRCMPDGLTPDYAVNDRPWDGYALGDPQETMLARALALCGYRTPAPAERGQEPSDAAMAPILLDYDDPGFGIYLKLP